MSFHHPNLPEFLLPPVRFGNEIEVHTNPNLKDGSVILYGSRYLWIGTRPLTLMEECGREARMIVRRGMADVLAWLGHEVEIEPTGRQILDRLRREGDPMRMLAITNNHGVVT